MQCSGVKELIACYTSFAYIYEKQYDRKIEKNLNICLQRENVHGYVCVYIYLAYLIS